ncbi:Pimeloyl-ACP methyl ester carboxylesterase [Mucilaginibacter gossypiicola]|uniref:Pimeloyl-ACP methyl ester carboxylesterase n=1 Tax=Mucilaginibacter gossypiicola TaxID=551995 RepID=A0A1H8D224_9SPHI|nr:alpha/beta hydrolase [Mucilaginibacter gossypiicola]SEN00547.1 Pimeloyl-ACP methyl ester carboxylesterase [Mucilaginibacter gossypiicola]
MKQNLILLHGLFGGLSNWKEVIDYFKDQFNIYVPELPLYEDHKIDRLHSLLNFLELSIDAAGLQNVILVGNSLGGHIAILYTLKHPENVSKLVLTGSSGLYENTQFGSYLKRNNYEYIKDRVAATFHNPAFATDELVAEVLNVTTNSFKCLCAIKTAKATQRDNVLARLPQISVPVLLIWGDSDQITPPAVAFEFKDHLPNVKLVMISECGHAPMMEHPEKFNDALDQFLQENA